jgi:hypothetical protein
MPARQRSPGRRRVGSPRAGADIPVRHPTVAEGNHRAAVAEGIRQAAVAEGIHQAAVAGGNHREAAEGWTAVVAVAVD